MIFQMILKQRMKLLSHWTAIEEISCLGKDTDWLHLYVVLAKTTREGILIVLRSHVLSVD